MHAWRDVPCVFDLAECITYVISQSMLAVASTANMTDHAVLFAVAGLRPQKCY